jgi:hypothetical protein
VTVFVVSKSIVGDRRQVVQDCNHKQDGNCARNDVDSMLWSSTRAFATSGARQHVAESTGRVRSRLRSRGLRIYWQ